MKKNLWMRGMCFLLAVTLVLGLTPQSLMEPKAASAAEQDAQKAYVTEREYISGGCQIKYHTQSRWGDCAVVELSVTNQGNGSIKLDSLRFFYQAEISGIWNATIRFGKLDFQRASCVCVPEKLYAENVVGLTQAELSKGTLTLSADSLRLEQDETVHGDLILQGGYQYINAYRLYVMGDLTLDDTQQMEVTQGALEVEGDLTGAIRNQISILNREEKGKPDESV